MKAFLDTNILIRHLTGNPSSQAKRATALLRGAHELILPDLVVAEMVYVLESYYGTPRNAIARMVRALLALPSIAVVDHELLLRAVEFYEVLRLDFAESYLAALAERSDVRRVASFDRQLDRVEESINVISRGSWKRTAEQR